jgi:hypothetical protein
MFKFLFNLIDFLREFHDALNDEMFDGLVDELENKNDLKV